jgi:hypothetical protein
MIASQIMGRPIAQLQRRKTRTLPKERGGCATRKFKTVSKALPPAKFIVSEGMRSVRCGIGRSKSEVPVSMHPFDSVDV